MFFEDQFITSSNFHPSFARFLFLKEISMLDLNLSVDARVLKLLEHAARRYTQLLLFGTFTVRGSQQHVDWSFSSSSYRGRYMLIAFSCACFASKCFHLQDIRKRLPLSPEREMYKHARQEVCIVN